MAIGPGEVCGGSWQVCGLVIGGLLAVRHRLLQNVCVDLTGALSRSLRPTSTRLGACRGKLLYFSD
jgi:hypothetical protein